MKSGGSLETAINERFGSLEAMKTEMSATTVAVQGSGWGWLGYNPKSGKYEKNAFFLISCTVRSALLCHG